MTREEVLDEVNVIYERLSHPEDCENGVYSFRDGNYLGALEVLIDYYEVGFITELEKIKEEFEDRILLNQTVAIQIMDKYISEQKGGSK